MRMAQIFLMFFLPGVAAGCASGGVWRRLGWYIGTVVLAFVSVLALAVLYQTRHDLATIVALISVDVLMVALAASGRRTSK
jgi:hypothetical protein